MFYSYIHPTLKIEFRKHISLVKTQLLAYDGSPIKEQLIAHCSPDASYFDLQSASTVVTTHKAHLKAWICKQRHTGNLK